MATRISYCKRDILRALNKFKHRPGEWLIEQSAATKERPALVTLSFIDDEIRKTCTVVLAVQASTLKLARKTIFTSVVYNWQEVLKAHVVQ